MKTTIAMMVGALALVAGCAADAQQGDAAEEGADALTQSAVGDDVVAVEIHTIPMAARNVPDKTVVVALPTKVRRILRAMKKRGANDALPRCMPAFRNEVRFLDAKGKEKSKVSFVCGYGELTGGPNGSVPVKTDGTIDTVANDDLTVGDALWGITKVTVEQFSDHAKKTVTDADGIAELVDAIDGGQAPDAEAPIARCVPSHLVTFQRGKDDAAHAAVMCSNPTAKSVPATFSIPTPGRAEGALDSLASGRVMLDPRPFVALFGSSQ